MEEKIILRNKLIISLKNYEYNLKLIKEKIAPKKIILVIKANAYGMGYDKVIRVIKKCRMNQVAISCLQEAHEVRKIFSGEIHLLGDFLKQEVSSLLNLDVLIPITNYESAKFIEEKASLTGKKAVVQIYVDTGMGNLGLFHEKAILEIRKIMKLPHLSVKGIFSHFANADQENDFLTKQQMKRFSLILNAVENEIKRYKIKTHLANSDAVLNYPQSHHHHDLVRIGLALYGVNQKCLVWGLKPCLSFKSYLISKKLVHPPFSVGYAETFKIKKPTWVGTISAGYADGVPFALSNSGRVFIRSKEFPIIGRLSMDYLTIDLLDQEKNIHIGDEVVLLGKDKKSQKSILVEEWSKHKKTHPYDILCSFGSRRLDKIYL